MSCAGTIGTQECITTEKYVQHFPSHGQILQYFDIEEYLIPKRPPQRFDLDLRLMICAMLL